MSGLFYFGVTTYIICGHIEQYTDYIGRYSDRQKKEEAL